MITVGDVADLVREGVEPRTLGDALVVHYSIPALDAGAPESSRADSIASRKFRVSPGDVLLSRLNPWIRRVFSVTTHDVPALASTEFVVLRAKSRSDSVYLKFALMSPRVQSDLNGLVTGTSGSHQRVHARDILSLPLEWPRFEDRQRASSLLASLEKARQNRRDLCQGALRAADVEFRDLPHEAERPLGEILSLKKGLSYKGASLADAGTPLINMGNFGENGWYRPKGVKFYTGEGKDHHYARARELVIANTDLTHDYRILGRPILVPPDIELALATHHTFLAHFEDNSAALPTFFALRRPAYRQQVRNYATGTTVASIPKEAILSYNVGMGDHTWRTKATTILSRYVEAIWRWEREAGSLRGHTDRLIGELFG